MELSGVSSSAGEYIPAVLFLLASGLLLPFLYLVSTSGSTSLQFAVQISVLMVLALIVSLILGVIVHDVRLYAYAIAAIGIALRAASVILVPVSSDVLEVSVKGAALLLSGRNPYQASNMIFAYPPLEPLFYILFLDVDPRWGEFVSGSVIVLILLWTFLRSQRSGASLLYLALYSFGTLVVGFVGLSTNDTSASFFPFLGMWSIMFTSSPRRFDYAAVLFGLGVVFKQFGIFPLIFAIGYLAKRKGPWAKSILLATLTVAVVSLPFLLWSPMDFIHQVLSFHLVTRFQSPYYNLAALDPQLLGPGLLILQLTLTIGLGTFMLYRVRSWGECQIAWTGVFLLALFLGRYFAPSYFAFVMPFWIVAGIGRFREHAPSIRGFISQPN